MKSNENWICEVERLLEHIYPDRWSVSEYSSITGDITYHYYLLFPTIEISNSEGKSHTIKDLYVRFQFDQNGILLEIDGTRATFNQAEFESRYSHSHLSSTVAKDACWGGFCFGDEFFFAQQRFHYCDKNKQWAQ